MGIKETIQQFKCMWKDAAQVQVSISEAYMKGVNNTTKDLLTQITTLKNQVNKLINKNLENEKKVKQEYEERLREHDNRFKTKCTNCQLTTDSERTYLRNTQTTLTNQIKKIDYMFSRVKTYLNNVKDYHDEIMLNAGKVTAVDWMLLEVEKDFAELVKFSTPLLEANITEKEFIDNKKIDAK